MQSNLIKPRDRETVIQSLRAGVVPRRGQHLIQVGRVEEVKAIIRDLDIMADGGSAIRFVIGEYGSGKTFFLSLVRSIALEKKFVTVHADLNPDRRLHATSGQARSLYAELMHSMATRTKPEGGAMSSVIERFITSSVTEAREQGTDPEDVIRDRLSHLAELTGGYDFAEVIAAYWRGYDSGDELLKANAVRWLRGEFSTRTDARQALGVRTIIDDANVYDQLKLLTQLLRLAGYAGLLICLDELVNLYKLSNTQARKSNYEQILRILNDCLQGSSVGLGFMMGGTPDFLMDTRRGLYSYAALQSRLAENTFAVNGLVDYKNPVLRLGNLTPEELFVLLDRIRHVYASGEGDRYLISEDGIKSFMSHCSQRIGDAYFRTPRNTIKAYIDLLSVLEQNTQISWQDLIQKVEVNHEHNPDLLMEADDDEGSKETTSKAKATDDDELASFKL
jgi:hypothetical protein